MSDEKQNRLAETDTTVKEYAVSLCQACIDGIGKECHTPGCALFIHQVDIPIHRELLTEIEPIWDDDKLVGYKIKKAPEVGE